MQNAYKVEHIILATLLNLSTKTLRKIQIKMGEKSLENNFRIDATDGYSTISIKADYQVIERRFEASFFFGEKFLFLSLNTAPNRKFSSFFFERMIFWLKTK